MYIKTKSYGFAMILASLLVACTGAVDQKGSDDRPRDDGPTAGGNTPGPITEAACAKSAISPGRSPLRRLTTFEYNNTLEDLLGDATSPGDGLPAEDVGNGFSNDADAQSPSTLLVEGYIDAAEGVAKRALTDVAAFTKLVGCAPDKGDEACAKAFVDRFAMRAFRRPLESSDADELMGAFRRARETADFKTSISMLLQVILLSPEHLFHLQQGTAVQGKPGLAKPTHYEMASRLSYLLWGSMPDDELFAAAKAGELGSKDQVLKQAKRMLTQERSREVIRFFHSTLYETEGVMRVSKSAAFSGFDDNIKNLMREESTRFIDHVVWEGQGDLKTLLTAPYTFLSDPLAKFYGLAKPSGAGFSRVDLDPSRAAGIVTQGSIMATTSPGSRTKPVGRGKYVMLRALCEAPPPPPQGLVVTEPEDKPSTTTRERFIQHSTDPVCANCHKVMDPIGFAFENYTAAGTWRAMENGKTIDASGQIEIGDEKLSFNGPAELMKRLAQTPQASSCYVGKWLTFALGRKETDEDVCARAFLEKSFSETGGQVRDLILALTQTDSFLYRSDVATGQEVKQ